MIDELAIRGLGVIEDVTLELSPGLTVVTGETGAGKTMIVQALQLLLGGRGDVALVRAGAAAARVEARVTPPPPDPDADLVPDDDEPREPVGLEAWLEDGEDEVVVTREVRAEGRSRVRINGRMAPVSALARVLGAEVEVHAQHQHVRLARPEVQRHLLDRYAGAPHARLLAAYREAHAQLRSVQERLAALTDDAHARARTVDRLAHELAEIDAVGPTPQDEGIAARLQVLEGAEDHRVGVMRAAAALGSDGAGEPLGQAVADLRRVDASTPELDALRDRAEALAVEATELAVDLRTWADDLDLDEAALEEARERAAALHALQRKYGADVAAVLAYREAAAAELDALQRVDTDLAELTEQRDRLARDVADRAADVTRGRTTAAAALSSAVAAHLADLGMALATFEVVVAPAPSPGPNGADVVQFTLAANPGEPGGPFERVASGGERSRVALAIAVALADVHDARVLVFDEVDAGIGGATAMQVGAKLSRLTAGGTRQVLCVTHLAQLAAHADVHYVAEKGLAHGRTVTSVRRVADGGRVDELQRLLSGDAGGEAGRAHAQRLLDAARAV